MTPPPALVPPHALPSDVEVEDRLANDVFLREILHAQNVEARKQNSLSRELLEVLRDMRDARTAELDVLRELTTELREARLERAARPVFISGDARVY